VLRKVRKEAAVIGVSGQTYRTQLDPPLVNPRTARTGAPMD